jgi:Peptidase MA superfamily
MARMEPSQRTNNWRWMLTLWLILGTACSRVVPGHERAGDAAASPDGAASQVIPPIPKAFRSERVGRVSWAYPPSLESLAGELQRMVPRRIAAIEAALGTRSDAPIEVRIARSPDELHTLCPHDAPPPPYAVGVAYPALGLIVVSTVTPDSFMPPELAQVLTHELAHVLLYRAVHGRALPLWFTEGFAVAQAGEHRLARVRTLWEAAIVDDVLPLAELGQAFPQSSDRASLAYAQSADLVQRLTADARGKERLQDLVRILAEGASFEDALLRSFHVDSFTLERDFRRSLSERFRLWPMLLTGSALWGGIALLALVAFVRRRRAQRERLAEWEREEAAEARPPRIQMVTAVRLPVPANGQGEDVSTPHWYVSPRDPGIPTIEHDGERHTLH